MQRNQKLISFLYILVMVALTFMVFRGFNKLDNKNKFNPIIEHSEITEETLSE